MIFYLIILHILIFFPFCQIFFPLSNRLEAEFENYKKEANVNKENLQPKKQSIYEKYYSRKGSAQSEVDLYLKSPVTEISNGDILLYWKMNKERYPTLSAMAHDYLAASSAAVESVFSTAGHLLNKKRSKLGLATFEALLVLNSWQKDSLSANEN